MTCCRRVAVSSPLCARSRIRNRKKDINDLQALHSRPIIALSCVAAKGVDMKLSTWAQRVISPDRYSLSASPLRYYSRSEESMSINRITMSLSLLPVPVVLTVSFKMTSSQIRYAATQQRPPSQEQLLPDLPNERLFE